MSAPQMTTAEALRSALASTIACSAQELQEAVGQVVVATAAELPASSAVGPADRSLFDATTSTLVLLADCIPAGQEAAALASEIERHHGHQAAQLVLGERANELLGGDGKVQGSVERAVAVNKLNEAVQVERNTELLGRNQAAMAERAFEAYDFGEGVAVAGVSGWEYYAAGHERSREVYVENVNTDGKENPSTRLGFTVRYDPQTGVLAEAYAEDAKGSAFGCMPEGQLEKLNADSAVGRVEPPTATLNGEFVPEGEVASTTQLQTLDQHKLLQRDAHDVAIRLLYPEQFHGDPSLDGLSDRAAALIRQMAQEIWLLKRIPEVNHTHGSEKLSYRVLGAHPNRNFFAIEVQASDGLSAFGAAAVSLKEADEDGEAEFFAAIPAHIAFDFPGDGVVTLGTVLDPEQADVFGLEASANVDDDHSPGM